MLGNPCQHSWAYFFAVVEGEYVLRPTGTGKNTMGTAVLPLDCPTNAKQGSEDLLSLC
jgi:hypothetical protein